MLARGRYLKYFLVADAGQCKVQVVLIRDKNKEGFSNKPPISIMVLSFLEDFT